MIHISGDWYLGGDPSNIILKQRKINKENGKEYFNEVAYPGTFEQLMNSLSRRRVRINIEAANDLKELIAIEKAIQDDNAKFYKRFKKEINEKLKEESESERANRTGTETCNRGTGEGE